jgi:hypothetical protein
MIVTQQEIEALLQRYRKLPAEVQERIEAMVEQMVAGLDPNAEWRSAPVVCGGRYSQRFWRLRKREAMWMLTREDLHEVWLDRVRIDNGIDEPRYRCDSCAGGDMRAAADGSTAV